MRNANGTFSTSNQFAVGHGRPEGSGKQYVKDMVMAALERVVWLVFGMPEAEMEAWMEQHGHELSIAERIMIESSQDLAFLEWLMDRILGKSVNAQVEIFDRNPAIERLYSLTTDNLNAEIDDLIHKRNLVRRELSNP